MAGLLPRREVRRPESSVAPRVDLPGWGQVSGEDRLACVGVDQRKLLWVVLTGGDDECLLGGLNVVAYLIDDYVDLAGTHLCTDAAETNCQQ